MPELPEVETVRLGLIPALEGRKLVNVEQFRRELRWPIPCGFAEKVTGRRVTALQRRAKYILCYLDDGMVIMLHLGMSGRLRICRDPAMPRDRHDHIVFHTDGGAAIRFNDPRRFGVVDLCPAQDLACHRLLAGLGPEPLGNEFNGPGLLSAFSGRRTPVKTALLDQRMVAGLGNIYVCEALHASGISPLRLAGTVSGRRCERLVAAIRTTLRDAIAAGGSSLRDHVQPSGEMGYFQHTFRVYGRESEPCPDPACTGQIRRIRQSGRSTFYCPRCQR